MISAPEDYFSRGCGRCARFDTADCSTRVWREGLLALRRMCRDMGLKETVKWGHPCFTHEGRNIAILGAFRTDFRLTFMNASLLRDTEGVLERQGPNSQTSSTIRFTRAEQAEETAATIRAYLRQLMDHAEAGTKPPKTERETDVPEELSEAMDADPELAEAFLALTPGRRRSYMFNLNQARRPETRRARIETFRERILAGKGPMDR